MGDVPMVATGAALAVLAGWVPVRLALVRARAAGHAEGFQTGWSEGYAAGSDVERRAGDANLLRYRERAQLALKAVQSAGGVVPAELLEPGASNPR